MALRQLTPEEKARMSGTNGAAPSSLGTGAGATVANPRSTPASQAAASVPKTYETPPIVQPGQSQSQLRSLTNNEAVNIQKARDTNYGQNTNTPALMSNPRDIQIASGGGVQQAPQTVGGTGDTPPLSFGDNLPKASAAQIPQVPGKTTPAQLPTGGQGTGAPTMPAGQTNAAQGQLGGTPAPVDQNGQPVQTDQNGQPVQQPNPEGGNADLIDQAANSQKQGANDYFSSAQAMQQQTLDVAENARRLQMIGTLNGTNAQSIAQSMGLNLTDMTTQQLEGLLVNSGLEPNKAVTDRISQEGAAAIDSVKMEAGDLLAENKYTADQISRTLGRSVDDRERFNIQQDAKLKKLMAVYGGGSSSASGNVSILQAEEQGQRALEDLNAEYAGRMDQIGRQANAITRQAADQTRAINNQVQDAIQSKYAEVQAKAQELIAAGVSNQKDYNAAMTPILKEYTGLYNDATKWGAEQHIANQKTVFDQMTKLQDMQMQQDKQLSDQFGIVFQNGQPVMGPDGNPMSTLEATKFATTEDRLNRQLEQDAQQFSQRLGFDINKEQFSQMMDQAKFSQGVDEFNQTMGFNVSKEQFNQMKELAVNGLQAASGYQMAPTGSINPNKSVYGIIPNGNGIAVNAKTIPADGTDKQGNPLQFLKGDRRQCGEYTNDALGMPNYFGNTLASKKAKVTTQVPSAGSAFVLDQARPYGHVGVVEQVNPDGTLVISESNYDGHEHFRRITTTMQELRSRNLVGFTGGLQAKSGLEANPNGPIGGNAAKKTEGQAANQGFLERMLAAEQTFNEVAPSIESAATGARNIPIIGGLIGGTLGTGRDLPAFMQGPEIQRQKAAEEDFLQAVLRKESKGAITEQEFKDYRPKFFPMPGDTPEVIESKRQRRQQEMLNMEREAGNQVPQGGGNEPSMYGGQPETWDGGLGGLGDMVKNLGPLSQFFNK